MRSDSTAWSWSWRSERRSRGWGPHRDPRGGPGPAGGHGPERGRYAGRGADGRDRAPAAGKGIAAALRGRRAPHRAREPGPDPAAARHAGGAQREDQLKILSRWDKNAGVGDDPHPPGEPRERSGPRRARESGSSRWRRRPRCAAARDAEFDLKVAEDAPERAHRGSGHGRVRPRPSGSARSGAAPGASGRGGRGAPRPSRPTPRRRSAGSRRCRSDRAGRSAEDQPKMR